MQVRSLGIGTSEHMLRAKLIVSGTGLKPSGDVGHPVRGGVIITAGFRHSSVLRVPSIEVLVFTDHLAVCI
jgi:hypothetical protein